MTRPFNLGRGVVSINGTSMGNCNPFTFSAEPRIVEHKTYYEGLEETEYIIIGWSYSGSFTTDTFTAANLKRGLGTAVSGGSDALVTVGFAGAAGLPDAQTVDIDLPNCIVSLSQAQPINGDDWQKATFQFRGSKRGTDLIEIS